MFLMRKRVKSIYNFCDTQCKVRTFLVKFFSLKIFTGSFNFSSATSEELTCTEHNEQANHANLHDSSIYLAIKEIAWQCVGLKFSTI